MKCDCGFDLQECWSFCPDCGEHTPPTEEQKSKWRAEHEEKYANDPKYRERYDRDAERRERMRPLMDVLWKQHSDQFINEKDPFIKLGG